MSREYSPYANKDNGKEKKKGSGWKKFLIIFAILGAIGAIAESCDSEEPVVVPEDEVVAEVQEQPATAAQEEQERELGDPVGDVVFVPIEVTEEQTGVPEETVVEEPTEGIPAEPQSPVMEEVEEVPPVVEAAPEMSEPVTNQPEVTVPAVDDPLSNGQTDAPVYEEPVYEEPVYEEPVYQEPVGMEYLLNTNTMKFHYPGRSCTSSMKDEHKWYYTGTRDEIINMGYGSCGKCNP